MKLTKEQQAIINLAKIIDTIPSCDYGAFKETLDILELEWVTNIDYKKKDDQHDK